MSNGRVVDGKRVIWRPRRYGSKRKSPEGRQGNPGSVTGASWSERRTTRNQFKSDIRCQLPVRQTATVAEGKIRNKNSLVLVALLLTLTRRHSLFSFSIIVASHRNSLFLFLLEAFVSPADSPLRWLRTSLPLANNECKRADNADTAIAAVATVSMSISAAAVAGAQCMTPTSTELTLVFPRPTTCPRYSC